jgi:hypothetical protein
MPGISPGTYRQESIARNQSPGINRQESIADALQSLAQSPLTFHTHQYD